MKEGRPTSFDVSAFKQRLNGLWSDLHAYMTYYREYLSGKNLEHFDLKIEYGQLKTELKALENLIHKLADEKVQQEYVNQLEMLKSTLEDLEHQINSPEIKAPSQEKEEPLSSTEVETIEEEKTRFFITTFLRSLTEKTKKIVSFLWNGGSVAEIENKKPRRPRF